jgi:hypothetical protein
MANKMPFMKFFPKDWQSDTKVLTAEARGAWIDLICHLWQQPQRGVWTASLDQISRVTGVPDSRINAILSELQAVADIRKCPQTSPDFPPDVSIMSRRMLKEEKEREYERNKKIRQRMSPKCPPIVPLEKSEVILQKAESRLKPTSTPKEIISRKSAISDPRVKDLIDFFFQGQHFKLKQPPQAFPGAQAARFFKSILTRGMQMPDIQHRIENWFMSTDTFVVREAFRFGLFETRFDALKDGPLLAKEVSPNGKNNQGTARFSNQSTAPASKYDGVGH